MHILIAAPVFRTELLHKGMDYLEHVHAVEAGVESFIACVVCAAVQHAFSYELSIIAVKQLAQEQELIFET